jgi:hypothetical protein
LTEKQIEELAWRNPRLGLGVAGGFGGLVPVDIDTDDQKILPAVCSALPEPVVCKAGKRGFTAFYWDGGSGMINAAKYKMPKGGGEFDMLVEVLTTGQTVIPPTIHPDLGKPYEWITEKTLFNTRVHELSVITVEHITNMVSALSPWIGEKKKYEPAKISIKINTSSNRYESYARAILNNDVRSLSSMASNSGRNHALFIAACKIGKYVHHRVISCSEVENALLGACQSNGLWNDRDCGEKGCRATLRSGLNKAVSDALPALSQRQDNKNSGVSSAHCV